MVDTSVLVDHLCGIEAATKVLTGAVDSSRLLASSVLCRLEVQAGMRRGEERRTNRLLEAVEWWDDPILDRAASLARRHGPANRGIGAVDYCLAATTLLLEADLVTMNVKHFPMFGGLAAPY
ncbi:MAG: PIN domain-containing protein [Acidimicrobiales bacterium]